MATIALIKKETPNEPNIPDCAENMSFQASVENCSGQKEGYRHSLANESHKKKTKGKRKMMPKVSTITFENLTCIAGPPVS
jgi:hypothetical protein